MSYPLFQINIDKWRALRCEPLLTACGPHLSLDISYWQDGPRRICGVFAPRCEIWLRILVVGRGWRVVHIVITNQERVISDINLSWLVSVSRVRSCGRKKIDEKIPWQQQLKINQGAWNLMQCQWFLLSFCTLFCRAFYNFAVQKVLTCRREWGTDCGTRGRCWGSPRPGPWRRRWSCRAGGRWSPPAPGHSWPGLKHDTGDIESIHTYNDVC